MAESPTKLNSKSCDACGRQIIFLRTAKGKLIPINAETVELGDQQFDHSRHVSHFSDCPAAAHFRRPKED